MRKLASIQKIWDVVPIENADAIELVKVLGWQCAFPSLVVVYRGATHDEKLPPAQLSTNLASLGTDLISRQAAIDAIEAEKTKRGDYLTSSYVGYEIAEKVVAELPPAEPKRGKWILDRSGAYCCSECMEPCAGYVMMKPRDKFCKMCGSRNEVTE